MSIDSENHRSRIPEELPPSKWEFISKTWSGRLFLINLFVFLLMSWESGSLMMPSDEVLLKYGAKDVVLLVQGEYWRFLTPIFVHIGFFHFFFNSMGLYYIGYQIESLLGVKWFLIIYLVAGLFGNIASSYFSVSVSAGASGALFGLLGAGYFVEKALGQLIEAKTGRKPRGAYTSMVVVNVIFGFVVPGIDNAAHLGGMVSGIALTHIMLDFRPNRLRVPSRSRGKIFLMILFLVGIYGLHKSVQADYQLKKLSVAVRDASHFGTAKYFIDRGFEIDPQNKRLHFELGRLYLLVNYFELGLEEMRQAMLDPESSKWFEELKQELSEKQRMDALRALEELLQPNM